jgi:hypothetical protein
MADRVNRGEIWLLALPRPDKRRSAERADNVCRNRQCGQEGSPLPAGVEVVPLVHLFGGLGGAAAAAVHAAAGCTVGGWP